MSEREHHPQVSGQPRIFVRGRHRTHIVPAVMPEALARAGWSMVDGFDCDVLWDMPGPNEGARSLLRAEQRYNYFADAHALGNKFELYRHLCAARAALGRSGAALYDFFPRTFSMPEEYGALRRAAAGAPEARWICKPKRAARGEGLTVLHDVRDAPRDPEWLVQEYIAAPHLIDGRKYSLRIYALLTSLDPLQAYLYREGRCSIASRAYNLDAAGLGDPFVHLTNHAVASKDRETAEPVRYLMLSEYLRWMREHGHDDAALWARIRQAVASTLLAVRGSMLQAMRSHGWAPERCFELAASGPEHLAMAIRLRHAFAEAARRRGAREAVIHHESELGNLYDQYGAAEEAHASHVRALAAGGEADPWLRFNAAVTAFRAGLFAEADERFGALLAAEEAEADGPAAELLAAQAMVAAARGEATRVERLVAAARALAERQGEAARIDVALCEGESWLRLGERARASAALRRGLAAIERCGGVPGVDRVGFHVALAECDERDPTHVLAALRLLPKALVMEEYTWWHVPRLLRRVLGLAEQGWPGQVTEVEAWKYELRRLVRFAACRRDCGAEAARLGALLDHFERAGGAGSAATVGR